MKKLMAILLLAFAAPLATAAANEIGSTTHSRLARSAVATPAAMGSAKAYTVAKRHHRRHHRHHRHHVRRAARA